MFYWLYYFLKKLFELKSRLMTVQYNKNGDSTIVIPVINPTVTRFQIAILIIRKQQKSQPILIISCILAKCMENLRCMTYIISPTLFEKQDITLVLLATVC